MEPNKLAMAIKANRLMIQAAHSLKNKPYHRLYIESLARNHKLMEGRSENRR